MIIYQGVKSHPQSEVEVYAITYLFHFIPLHFHERCWLTYYYNQGLAASEVGDLGLRPNHH